MSEINVFFSAIRLYNSIVLGSDLEIIKGFIAPFVTLSKDGFRTALRDSFAGCPDGMNGGDMGSDHRLSCIKTIPGLILPAGVVTLDRSSDNRPKNTTYMVIPVSGEIVFRATANCVKRKRESVYELTKKDVSDAGEFGNNGRLLDVDDVELQHFMVGITRTKPRKDRSVRFVVRLLGGRIDFSQRLFYADIDEVILSYDTREDDLNLSRDVLEDLDTDADGPKPQLRRKDENDGSQ